MVASAMSEWAPTRRRADPARHLRRLAWPALLYLVVISAGALGFVDVLAFGAAFRKTSESLFAQLLWPTAYLLFVGLALAHRREVIGAARRCWWLLLFPAAVALSFLWSADPSATFDGAIRIAATTLMGIYIGARFDLHEQARAVFWVLLLAVGASAAAGVASVDFATMPDGTTRGLFYHKNGLGSRAALLVVAGLTLIHAGSLRPLAVVGVVVGALGALLSQSAAGVALSALALLAVPLAVAVRGSGTGVLVRLATIGAAAAFAAFALVGLRVEPVAEILAALERDATLTGRILLWEQALQRIAERPLLGFGFEASWHAAMDWRTLQALDRLGDVLNFHNSFLEVGVALGLLGLAIAAVTVAAYVRAAILALRMRVDRAALWPALFGVSVGALAMVENELFVQHNLFHLLFLAIPVAVFRQVDQLRNGALAPAREQPAGPREWATETDDAALHGRA